MRYMFENSSTMGVTNKFMFLSEAQEEKASHRDKFVSLQVNFFAAVVICCCGNCLFQQWIP